MLGDVKGNDYLYRQFQEQHSLERKNELLIKYIT